MNIDNEDDQEVQVMERMASTPVTTNIYGRRRGRGVEGTDINESI